MDSKEALEVIRQALGEQIEDKRTRISKAFAVFERLSNIDEMDKIIDQTIKEFEVLEKKRRAKYEKSEEKENE